MLCQLYRRSCLTLSIDVITAKHIREHEEDQQDSKENQQKYAKHHRERILHCYGGVI